MSDPPAGIVEYDGIVARRLTITIEDDIAARLEETARREGTAFEDVVSDALRRRALPAEESKIIPKPYVFPPGPRLKLKPGIRLGKVEELLDEIEGPWRK